MATTVKHCRQMNDEKYQNELGVCHYTQNLLRSLECADPARCVLRFTEECPVHEWQANRAGKGDICKAAFDYCREQAIEASSDVFKNCSKKLNKQSDMSQEEKSSCENLCENFTDHITTCAIEKRVIMCPRGAASISCYKKYTEQCTELWNDKFAEDFPHCGNLKESCHTEQYFTSFGVIVAGIALMATVVSLAGCYYPFHNHAHNE